MPERRINYETERESLNQAAIEAAQSSPPHKETISGWTNEINSPGSRAGMQKEKPPGDHKFIVYSKSIPVQPPDFYLTDFCVYDETSGNLANRFFWKDNRHTGQIGCSLCHNYHARGRCPAQR